jgi:hypothetical protein
MFDNNEIYNLLSSGMTPEQIAEEFSRHLNSAEAQIKAEEEARLEVERQVAAAKAAQEADMRRRVNDLAVVLREFCDFLEEYYPDMMDDQEMDEAELVELATAIVALLDLGSITVPVKKKEKPVIKSNDDVFTDFFKQFGLMN